MRITLRLGESVEENARRYFEAAKKARRKAKGAEKALERALEPKEAPPSPAPARRKRAWYERFRWCLSSDGLLLVGGRDATTNEALIKKHAEPGDLVFHTDMAGAPFVVIKAGRQAVPERTKEEAARFCAAFSRAWRAGLAGLEVFHVAPEQVSKEARAGEYLGKGAFMIRGETRYRSVPLEAAIGIDRDGRVMAGPPSAVATHCPVRVRLLPGRAAASDVAKALQRLLGGGTVDELVAALPPGGCALPAE